MLTREQFRKRVVRNSLFAPRSLGEAMKRLGFVQADPIRCPARAQDLILRHRVRNYRAGDLEQAYPKLGLEECYLYAYGFLSRDLWRVIHPNGNETLSDDERAALEVVEQHGPLHPKELEAHVGGERVRNYWGGFSRSAKMALEALQDCGALRVARREKGIRVYEAAMAFEQNATSEERFKEIVLAALRAMGATTRSFLLKELSHFRYLIEPPAERRRCVQVLIDAGRIRTDFVDGVEYISVADATVGRRSLNDVRILAPFDPIVRDRDRFEHLWRWTYRFEAYTPKAKRQLGYYAMPVLWRDQVVGWANTSVVENRLEVELGYVKGRPKGKEYRAAVKTEVERMARFLKLEDYRLI